MTREIRLLVLNCEFPPIGGGAARATEYILREFDAFPIQWTLVTSAADGRSRGQSAGKSGRIEFVPAGKKDAHFWTVRELLTYTLNAYRRVRRLETNGERYDLCHAFFTVPAGAVACARRRTCPYIVSLRGSDVPGRTGRFVWFYRLFAGVIRAIWRKAEAVIANSEELRTLAAETAGDAKIGVIPNGVDRSVFFPPQGERSGCRILSAGRLIAGKDFETLVRAAAAVKKLLPDTRLTIAGEGPEGARLRSLAREVDLEGSAEFPGWIPWGEVAELYRRADIFALTSAREGMSNVVLEALASGLPVVASRGALSGIQAPGAVVVETGDTAGLADAIASILADREARRRASAASLAAAERYGWEAVARSYYELYRGVLEGNRRGNPR
jgi:glycosyltransferase involved in cell wall biosynthesis